MILCSEDVRNEFGGALHLTDIFDQRLQRPAADADRADRAVIAIENRYADAARGQRVLTVFDRITAGVDGLQFFGEGTSAM